MTTFVEQVRVAQGPTNSRSDHFDKSKSTGPTGLRNTMEASDSFGAGFTKDSFSSLRNCLTPKNFGLWRAQIETPHPRPVGGSSDSDLLLGRNSRPRFLAKIPQALQKLSFAGILRDGVRVAQGPTLVGPTNRNDHSDKAESRG